MLAHDSTISDVNSLSIVVMLRRENELNCAMTVVTDAQPQRRSCQHGCWREHHQNGDGNGALPEGHFFSVAVTVRDARLNESLGRHNCISGTARR